MTENNVKVDQKFRNFFSSVSKITISEEAYNRQDECIKELAIAMKKVQ